MHSCSGRIPRSVARIPPLFRRGGIRLWVVALVVLSAGMPSRSSAAPERSLAPPRLLTLEAQLLERPPTIDGDLGDWPAPKAGSQARLERRDQLHPSLAEAWEGPEDASATVSLAVYGADLYLGVRFKDDRVFHDPERSWWHGDSLEVFFDSGRPAVGPAASEYSEDCRQVFLMPANPDLPWGVVYRGKRLTFDDGDLHGVEVARGDRLADGMTAEMRIPLSNFGLGQEAGQIGVAFALNDADAGQEESGTYLSWNQGFDLYLHPDHFGVLKIPGRSPPVEAAPADSPGLWWLLLAILLALAATVLMAGPGARWLARIGPRPKFVLLAVALGGALWIHLDATASVDAAHGTALGRLEAARSTAAAIVESARDYGALAEEDTSDRARALETLLRGGRIPCQPGVEDAAVVALHEEGRFAPEQAPPPHYSIDLRRPHTLFLPGAPQAEALTLRVDVGARGPRDQGARVLGTLTLRGRGGHEVERVVREVATARADDGASGRTQTIAISLKDEREPWERILWEPGEMRVPATLRSVAATTPTTDEAGGDEPRALHLTGRSRQGIPMLSHGPGADLGIEVEPGTPLTVPLPTVPGADRLWVLLRAEQAFPQLLGDAILGTLSLGYDEAGAPPPLEIRNGEHLVADLLPPGVRRPPEMRSVEAFRWTDSLGRVHRRQAIPIPLDPQRPARSLTVFNAGPGGTLRVVAASLVRTRYPPPESDVRIVTDEYGRDVLLLARVPESLEQVGEGAQEGGDAETSLVTRTFELGTPGSPLPLTLTERLPADIASKPVRARIGMSICLALAVFVLVLLAVDATSRSRFLSWRLGTGMLAAALVPLALTLFLVDRENTRRVESAFAERATAAVADFDRRLEDALERVQEAADRLARHLTAEEGRAPLAEISRLVGVYAASAETEGLVGSVAVTGASLPTLHVPIAQGREARGLAAPRFLQGVGERPALHVSPWDGLLLVGTARAGRTDDWVHVTIGVRMEGAFLAAALQESLSEPTGSAVLLDPHGRPLGQAGARPDSLRAALSAVLEGWASKGSGAPIVSDTLGGGTAGHLAVVQRVAANATTDADRVWLAVGVDRGVVDARLADERELLVWLGLFGLFLIVGVAALVARRIVDPVRELVRVTDSVRQGTFDVEAPQAGSDEVGQLSVALDQMRRDLKHRVEDLDFLRGAQETLAASLDFDRQAEVILQLFAGRFGPHRSVLLEARGAKGPVAVVAESSAERRFVERAITPAPGGWLATALQADAPLDVAPTSAIAPGAEASHDPTAPADGDGAMERRLLEDLAAWIVVPLRMGSAPQGLLLMGWADREALPSAEARRLLVPLAGTSAAAMNNARLYRLAALDEVTHLPGATAFEAALRADVESSLAGGPEAVLLRIGLDHMDHAALRRGVELARELLRTSADALLGLVGDPVRVGRLREEELAVRLPGATPEQAHELATAIRDRLGRVEVRPEEGGEPVGTTVSVGIARCPRDARSLEFLLDAAGRALAAAQREGGNHVEDAARMGGGAVDMPPFEEGAVFRNEAMVRVVEAARRAARSDASVFITGETGTGKEVIATLIHRRSDRAQRAFVTVNCAAFPETLLESELFGHERGAFTGAERRREGRFEIADGGTLFLDEVAEMTPSAQVKLLRVLQERQFTRLGGSQTITVDVRIVAATNRDLEKAVADGSFREDLYYRLNVIRLAIPPLRQRREEIPPLVDLFLRDAARRAGSAAKQLTPAAMDILYRHPWPGNVRELKNVIERCVVLTDGIRVGAEHLQLDGSRAEGGGYLPPQSAPQDDLNPRQRKLLDHLARHGRCTNREYYEMAGTSPRTGLRDLQDLMTRGLLVREGKRRGAVYRLP